MNFRDSVPIEFYNEKVSGKSHPKVRTVGELKKQLERLPDDLPLLYDNEEEVYEMVVYNIDSNAHLSLVEKDCG
jgi:hypothetical protein